MGSRSADSSHGEFCAKVTPLPMQLRIRRRLATAERGHAQALDHRPHHGRDPHRNRRIHARTDLRRGRGGLDILLENIPGARFPRQPRSGAAHVDFSAGYGWAVTRLREFLVAACSARGPWDAVVVHRGEDDWGEVGENVEAWAPLTLALSRKGRGDFSRALFEKKRPEVRAPRRRYCAGQAIWRCAAPAAVSCLWNWPSFMIASSLSAS